jgi:hypothetical protein
MNWKTIICLAAIALLVAGCGRKSTAPTEGGDYEQYFGKEFRAPKDRSIRISGRAAFSGSRVGSAVAVETMIYNGSKQARSLPIGIESNEGFTYSYFTVLVQNESGEIERGTFPAHEGDLVTIDLDADGLATETIPISDAYDFAEPGLYKVVVFYSVEQGTLPNGESPDWTGTIWTSPIVIRVE